MWQIVSNISSIVTCILFVLYVIGHIWKVFVTKNTRYEIFKVLPYNSDFDIDDNDNVVIIDDIGEEFSISSTYGIRNIEIFKINYEFGDNGSISLISKELKSTCKDININDTLYVRCDLGECVPTTQITIERMDYTKVTFELNSSGKTGNIIASNYNFKMTIRSLIYYLCV